MINDMTIDIKKVELLYSLCLKGDYDVLKII